MIIYQVHIVLILTISNKTFNIQNNRMPTAVSDMQV